MLLKSLAMRFYALSLGIIVAGSLVAADKDGFTPIFNGKNMEGWKFFFDPKAPKEIDTAKNCTVKDGAIICSRCTTRIIDCECVEYLGISSTWASSGRICGEQSGNHWINTRSFVAMGWQERNSSERPGTWALRFRNDGPNGSSCSGGGGKSGADAPSGAAGGTR